VYSATPTHADISRWEIIFFLSSATAGAISPA
jgi:hypothetical protein